MLTTVSRGLGSNRGHSGQAAVSLGGRGLCKDNEVLAPSQLLAGRKRKAGTNVQSSKRGWKRR
jgi:hypothetical protein